VSVTVVAQLSSEVPEGLNELPCILVFAFITRVEFVYDAFPLHYKLWEKRGITEKRVIMYISVCGRSKKTFCLFFFQTVF
jgi:hypothetical protein